MNLNKFMLYTTLGTFIWNTVLVLLGSLVGEKWENIVSVMNNYSHITLIALIIITILIIIKFYKNRNAENSEINVNN